MRSREGDNDAIEKCEVEKCDHEGDVAELAGSPKPRRQKHSPHDDDGDGDGDDDDDDCGDDDDDDDGRYAG